MRSLQIPPLFSALAGAEDVLVSGAGGGFDVYAGLPLAVALHDAGRRVHLANLSFTDLDLLDLDAWQAMNLARVEPDTPGPQDYFPEQALARWLAAQDLPATVYAFPRVGVQPLRSVVVRPVVVRPVVVRPVVVRPEARLRAAVRRIELPWRP